MCVLFYVYIIACRKYDELIEHSTNNEKQLDRLEQENRELKQKSISKQAKIEELEEVVTILEEKRKKQEKENGKLLEKVEDLHQKVAYLTDRLYNILESKYH